MAAGKWKFGGRNTLPIFSLLDVPKARQSHKLRTSGPLEHPRSCHCECRRVAGDVEFGDAALSGGRDRALGTYTKNPQLVSISLLKGGEINI